MRIGLLFCLLIFISHKTLSQVDNVGSGRAISFDGIDDRIEIPNSYTSLNLPFSVSAWVFVDYTIAASTPIFVSNDNNPTYRGFWFLVSPTGVLCEFGDGAGGNNPAFRRGKGATISSISGRWVNVCVVMIAPFDIKIYVNGIDVGGFSTGESNLGMKSPISGDVAKVNYFLSNNVVYKGKSIIDEVRLWNRALTESEVRRDMCRKLTGNEPGLIGYWDFNETSGSTVLDKSPTGADGQLIGNPARVFSGAPIGDASVYSYPASTTSLTSGALKLEASNISGLVEGIHIYEIKSPPSQTSGLDLANNNSPYFGVFLASSTGTGDFTVKGYTNNQPTNCKTYARSDNSKPSWSNVNLPLNQPKRAEFILTPGVLSAFDLGPDKVVCDQPNFTLTTMLNDPTFTYLWSTGESTPFITVSQSGIYSVKVTSPCGSISDQARVDFFQKPVFDLGPDKTLCDQTSYTISTQLSNPNFNYLWNTTQNTPYILVGQSGNYSVTVASPCGIVTDNIQVDLLRTPQPFSFGQDMTSCDPSQMTLKPYSDPLGFNYEWQDGSTNDSFFVSDFGKYWVSIKNNCGQVSDTITLTKYNLKIGFVPNVITPNGDDKNEFFQIDPIYSGLVSLKVLNRWGAEVFSSKSYKNDWNGAGLSAGVYYVVLEGSCIERFKGPLTIIR